MKILKNIKLKLLFNIIFILILMLSANFCFSEASVLIYNNSIDYLLAFLSCFIIGFLLFFALSYFEFLVTFILKNDDKTQVNDILFFKWAVHRLKPLIKLPVLVVIFGMFLKFILSIFAYLNLNFVFILFVVGLYVFISVILIVLLSLSAFFDFITAELGYLNLFYDNKLDVNSFINRSRKLIFRKASDIIIFFVISAINVLLYSAIFMFNPIFMLIFTIFYTLLICHVKLKIFHNNLNLYMENILIKTNTSI